MLYVRHRFKEMFWDVFNWLLLIVVEMARFFAQEIFSPIKWCNKMFFLPGGSSVSSSSGTESTEWELNEKFKKYYILIRQVDLRFTLTNYFKKNMRWIN